LNARYAKAALAIASQLTLPAREFVD